MYIGSIIKENNRFYFVDFDWTFHCSVFEDTKIYKNNDFYSYTSNFDRIEERECQIWVSCNVSYSGEYSQYKDDRMMTFKNSMSYDFQGTGFYDRVLDIYYECKKDDIEKHDFNVTISLFLGLLDDLNNWFRFYKAMNISAFLL